MLRDYDVSPQPVIGVDAICMGKRPKTSARRETGITLAALRTFVTVVEAESFSRAAELLGISQPGVSLQLHSLEQACRVLLLRRRPRLALTEAGRDLFVRARLIVSRLEEFEASVGSLRDLDHGQLSIGLSGPHIAMPLLGSFGQAYPAIALATRVGNTSALLADIGQCRIDIAIVAMAEAVASFHCTKVADLHLALCVRRDDPLARRRRVKPALLAGRDLIAREEGSVTRQLAERLMGGARVAPQVRMEVTGREALKEAVVAGLGIGFLFSHEVEGDQRLAAVDVEGAAPAAIYAVALRESLEIPAVRTFMEHVTSRRATRR
jgi:DNA-binding transcriptional LysR family regulator